MTTIQHEPNPAYKIELDYDTINNKIQNLELPHILKKQPKTTKNQNIKKDFKHLPQEIKYTNQDKYVDIDKVRSRLRQNEYDHMNYEPALAGKEGHIYFQDVYSTTYNNEEHQTNGEEKQ